MEENYVAGFFTGTVLEKGYGYISREIMRNCKISPKARLLYSYFMSFAGDKFNAFPSVKTILHELKMSKDTYYKSLNELKSLGLLYTELKKNEKGKWDKNIFHLTRNKSDIEKVKEFNKKVKKSIDKNVKSDKNVENTNFCPFPFEQDTVEQDTVNRETNKINPNNNTYNISLEEEVMKAYKEVKNRYLNTREKEVLKNLLKDYSKDLILKSIDIMVTDAEKITLKYITSCLEDWKSKGIQTVDEVDKARTEWQKTKNKHTTKQPTPKVVYKNKKESTFNNFEQRDYVKEYGGYDELEKKLLGWQE